ncbi:hypothetical protein VTH82DRAFT_7492 [Thermothelomyces myriococcoides]
MHFFPIVNKARKPKFDVHIKISDLNNVPLVSGVSMVKWYLPHSIHGEHRGRTQKCPIVNHRVEYNYSKIVPVRIGIDRNDCLNDCPIEFEVVQEFTAGGVSGAVGRDEKIILGTVRLNLSEYVEESEAVLRDGRTANAIKEALMSPVQKIPNHRRQRSSLGNNTGLPPETDPSPRSSRDEDPPEGEEAVQDGVVRRYLMQDSKVNSTLKISILMVQVDGERNFVAPPPKSAPMFGSIAGLVAGDTLEPVDVGTAATPGHPPSSFAPGKSRDAYEAQDMYRRALAASWASQPGELPADQCIENIFSGGEGFEPPPVATTASSSHARHHSRHHTLLAGHGKNGGGGGGSNGHSGTGGDTSPNRGGVRGGGGRRWRRRGRRGGSQDDSGSVSDDERDDENSDVVMGSLRPRDIARLQRQHHLREQSVGSDRSAATAVLAGPLHLRGVEPFPPLPSFPSIHHRHRREESKITHAGGVFGGGGGSGLRSRSSSVASLASTVGTTLGSDRVGRRVEGFKRAKEVDEFEVREDLVAWSIPGSRY